MTLDLDELERKAKAALVCKPEPWTPLVDSSGGGAWIHEIGNSDYDGQLPTPVIEYACTASPSVVLALIERVRKAETSQACEHGISGPRCPECPDGVTQHWAGVRELQERVRELEKRYMAPSQWRCDGCGCIERPIDGRRPDMHHGCGGMWIRQERTENA